MKLYIAHNYYSFIQSLNIIKDDSVSSVVLYNGSKNQDIKSSVNDIEQAFGVKIIVVKGSFDEFVEKKVSWLFPPVFEKRIKENNDFAWMSKFSYKSYEKIYIFNDETKLARYVIDKIDSYILIQEGMANFSTFSGRSRILHYLSDNLFFLRFTPVPMGRSRKCVDVIYTNLEYSIPLDLINKYRYCSVNNELNGKQKSSIMKLFDIHEDEVGFEYIILTQPIEVFGCSPDEKIKIYETLLRFLKRNSSSVAIKIHPCEDASFYKSLNCPVIGNYPVELIAELSYEVKFISIFSSCTVANHVRIFDSAGHCEEGFSNDDVLNTIENLLSVGNYKFSV